MHTGNSYHEADGRRTPRVTDMQNLCRIIIGKYSTSKELIIH